MKLTTKLKYINIWYKFRPNITMWIVKHKSKTKIIKLYDQTWYDGYTFLLGLYGVIQLKYFAICFTFYWWKIKL